MRTIGSAVLAAAVLLVVFAGGCGDDTKCTGESPQVNAVGACSARPGDTVNYELRLCPTCNQTLTSCTVDMSGADQNGGTIFLNPVVDTCDTGDTCGPSCLPNPATCSVTVPSGATPGTTTYTVLVYDPGIGTTRNGTLAVGDQPPNCDLPTL
jgi:hypothetical protein